MWLPLPRLYRLRPRAALRDELSEIGAGDRPGIFDPHPRTPLGPIHQVVARHEVALVHPVPDWCRPMLWWALRRAAGGVEAPWLGPPLYVDDSAFALPSPGADGLSVAAALRRSLLAVPGATAGRWPSPLGAALLQLLNIEGAASLNVLELAAFRQVDRFARRVLSHRETAANAQSDAGLSGKFDTVSNSSGKLPTVGDLTALPSAAVLRRWYADLVAAHWHRLVVSRFVAELVAGELVAQVGRRRVPTSFFEAAMKIDLEHGALLTPYEVPLYRDLRIWRRADAPEAYGDDEPRAVRRRGGRRRAKIPPANPNWGRYGGQMPTALVAARDGAE